DHLALGDRQGHERRLQEFAGLAGEQRRLGIVADAVAFLCTDTLRRIARSARLQRDMDVDVLAQSLAGGPARIEESVARDLEEVGAKGGRPRLVVGAAGDELEPGL